MKDPFGYLLIDLTPRGKDHYCFRMWMFQDEYIRIIVERSGFIICPSQRSSEQMSPYDLVIMEMTSMTLKMNKKDATLCDVKKISLAWD